MVICSALGIPATAEEEVPIYKFGGRYFSLVGNPSSYVYGPEESGICDWGSFTSQCWGTGGRMVRNLKGITFYPDDDPLSPSHFKIGISFDSPADLSAVDFFDIDYAHTELKTPLSGIYLRLENGKTLRYIGTFVRSGKPYIIGRFQTKIPVYEFEGRGSDSYIAQQMIGVTELTIEFEVLGDSTVLAKSFGSWILNKKAMGLKTRVEVDSGNKMLAIESDRPVGPDELYRLELSSDLVRWQINSQLFRGTGEKALFKKTTPKAPWYRLSFFNYVDVEP